MDSSREPLRITATDACQKYKLHPDDLSRIECLFKRNPHRPSRYMRLFIESEVEELAKVVMQEKIDNQTRYISRKLQEKEKAKTMAIQKVEDFKKPLTSIRLEGSEGKLPMDVWEHIIKQIASEYEPLGIIRMNTIVKRLAITSQVCKDAYIATKAVLPTISIPSNPFLTIKPEIKEIRDTLIHTPTKLTIPMIKDVLRAYGLQVTGTKPELIMRFFNKMNIKDPLPAYVSGDLYMTCFKERTSSILELEQNLAVALQFINKYKSDIPPISSFSSPAHFQEHFSSIFRNSQDVLGYADTLKKEYENYIIDGKTLVGKIIQDMCIPPQYITFISEADLFWYGVNKHNDIYFSIKKKLNKIMKAKADMCLICTLNKQAMQCPHNCCRKCCIQSFQGCARHVPYG